MTSILKILRRIGGTKTTPTAGDEGQLAVWKAGKAATDAASLYFHDGVQWVELIDTAGRKVSQPVVVSETAPATPSNGEFWFKTSTKELSTWDGAQWSHIAFTNASNTFTMPQTINANAATPALRVTQTGAGASFLVEDEANPDATPFTVDAAGAVGIGTATPYTGFKLHVKAASGSHVLISGGQQNNLMFSSAATVGGFVMGRSYLVDNAQNFFIRDETASALRMFIASNGHIGFGGTQDPQKELDVVGGLRVMQNLPATSGAIVIRANIGNTVGGHIQFVDNGATAQLGFMRFNTSGDFNLGNTGQSFSVLQNGTIQSPQTYVNTGAGTSICVAATGEFYRSSSSIKYKKDVEALDPALTDKAIRELRPIWYRTKNPMGDDKAEWSHIGLIAEEVAKVEKRLVNYRTVDVSYDADGNQVNTPLADPIPEDVDYARLSVLLLDYVQRLEKRVAVLEARP